MNTIKHSFRLRLAVILVGVTAGVLIAGVLINNFFLGAYFTAIRQNDMINMYDNIDSVYRFDYNKNAIVYKNSDVDRLRNRCYNMGVQMIIIDNSYGVRFSNVSNGDAGAEAELLDRAKRIVFNKDEYKKELIAWSENYQLYTYKAPNVSTEYMEMFGELDCGYLFLARITNESILEVASVANRFYINVGIIMTVIVLLLTGFISSRIAKPLRELANVSKRMSKLEFDVKYKGKSKDEIGILGQSMNEMSDVLEKTISELKSANNELKKDIEKKTEIDELRKEFISNVSHELKTPIALIQGYAEGLKESVNDDEESREFYCDVIMDEAKKMNGMVKKLLTLNQIEYGNIQAEYERFDIIQTIDNILNQTQILLEEKNITIDFDNSKPEYVWSDEFQIEEVITNYISNAINHIGKEKIITIIVERSGGIVKVSIENTGENIPDESLERIWDKFYKVDKARTREYGGSGIGLSIVKAIISSLHMEYGVENTLDGVKFWFTVESDVEIRQS